MSGNKNLKNYHKLKLGYEVACGPARPTPEEDQKASPGEQVIRDPCLDWSFSEAFLESPFSAECFLVHI